MSQNQQRIAHPLDDSPSIPHTPPSQGATTSLETPSAATFTLFKKLSAELQVCVETPFEAWIPSNRVVKNRLQQQLEFGKKHGGLITFRCRS